jgi:hypothetical protein
MSQTRLGRLLVELILVLGRSGLPFFCEDRHHELDRVIV